MAANVVASSGWTAPAWLGCSAIVWLTTCVELIVISVTDVCMVSPLNHPRTRVLAELQNSAVCHCVINNLLFPSVCRTPLIRSLLWPWKRVSMRADVFLHARMHVLEYTRVYIYFFLVCRYLCMHEKVCTNVSLSMCVHKMCMHEWEGN